MEGIVAQKATAMRVQEWGAAWDDADMDPQALMEELAGPDGPTHARRLAEAMVDHLLSRPILELAGPDVVLDVLRTACAKWDAPRLEAFVTAEVDRVTGTFRELQGPLRAHLVEQVTATITAELRQPLPLDPAIVMPLVDQPTTRTLIRELLQVSITNFARQASTPLSDSRVISGVMSRAKGFVTSGMTGAFIGAVGESLNQEAERRVREFVDGTVSAALQQMVGRVCDRRSEDAYGALRAGVLDSALDVPVRKWVEQVLATQPGARTVRTLMAAQKLVQAPEFEAWLRTNLPVLLPAAGTLSGRDWLVKAGVLDGVRAAAIDYASAQTLLFFRGAHFKLWLEDIRGNPREKKTRAKRTRGT